MDYLRLLRPKQWIKNLFVFAALIFARDVFQLPLLGLTAAAFVLFCLSSSGVYIINDILDGSMTGTTRSSASAPSPPGGSRWIPPPVSPWRCWRQA